MMNFKTTLVLILLIVAVQAPASQYFFMHSTKPGSKYFWQHGQTAGSEYYWKYGREEGSAFFWKNGRELGSRYFWENSRLPGSKYFWDYGREAGSRYYWENGTGPGSLRFWKSGRDPSFAPFLTSLCKSSAIDIEPCMYMNVAGVISGLETLGKEMAHEQEMRKKNNHINDSALPKEAPARPNNFDDLKSSSQQ